MMQADTPPNQTIYINNLNEKVKKEGECRGCSVSFLVRTGESLVSLFSIIFGSVVSGSG